MALYDPLLHRMELLNTYCFIYDRSVQAHLAEDDWETVVTVIVHLIFEVADQVGGLVLSYPGLAIVRCAHMLIPLTTDLYLVAGIKRILLAFFGILI